LFRRYQVAPEFLDEPLADSFGKIKKVSNRCLPGLSKTKGIYLGFDAESGIFTL
jgi:hypothetical protein